MDQGRDTGLNGAIGRKAEVFFEGLWRGGDPWQFETSEYDQASYRCQVQLLSDRRYRRALEIGCGAGAFTRHLAPFVDRLVAIDVALTAIDAAQRTGLGSDAVEFRVANVMEDRVETEQQWELIVLGETIYYLGWLYPFFDVYWLAHRLFHATPPGGRLLMTNTCGGPKDYLQSHALIRSYRDLFVNVGYEIGTEQVVKGRKQGCEFEALITLFLVPADATAGVSGGRV